MQIQHKFVGLGVACGAAALQLAWWTEPGSILRLLASLPFLFIGVGVYRGGARWLAPALLAISILLLAVVLTPLPDWEQPRTELPDVTTAFLEVRLCVTTVYAMGMLWLLSVRWRQERSLRK